MKVKHYGENKPNILLLLHGEEASSWIWEETLEKLTEEFHCITIDLPGHATSKDYEFSINDTAILITKIFAQIYPNKKIHIAGVGVGAQVALKLAYDYSYLVQSLILSGITVDNSNTRLIKKLTAPLSSSFKKTEGYIKKRMSTMGIPLKKFLEFQKDVQSLDPELVKLVRQEKMAFSLPDYIVPMNVPVLIIHGEKEETIVKKSNLYLENYFVTFQKIEIDNGKHLWMIEKPNVFSDLTLRFLKVHFE